MNSTLNNSASSPCKRFESVNVPDSPLSKPGNLTGNPRHVRDLVAQLYNYIQEWNVQQTVGISKLTSIVDLKTLNIQNPEIGFNNRIYPSGLQKLCQDLSASYEKMVSLMTDMEVILPQFKGLSKLEAMKKNESVPIFLTWPIQSYVSVSDAIVTAYRKEAQVKKVVKENIGHAQTVEDLTMYFALWVYQPYIESIIESDLEAMLKETGHSNYKSLVTVMNFDGCVSINDGLRDSFENKKRKKYKIIRMNDSISRNMILDLQKGAVN